MTIQKISIALTQKVTRDIINAVRNIPEDKLLWEPKEQGRSARAILHDCIWVNLLWAEIIASRGVREKHERLDAFFAHPPETLEDCISQLQAETEALCQAIATLTEDEIDKCIAIGWQAPKDMTLAEACLYPYYHMAYHEGQLAYLQRLYGDLNEYHTFVPLTIL
jgi:uncharacterized damage-inducible protein DinB